jgi:hypothetical protein
MSKVEVNEIDKQSGSTLTIGGSGTTVQLGTGATQTGFGRTGTVDWQTSDIKTSTFTAVSGQGFFCDTNGGAFTCNLPAGTAGAIVSLQDYRNTFDTAALTVAPNGSNKINGGAGNIVLSTEGEGLTLVYIDSTVGWRSIQDNVFADVGSNFVSATGGSVATVDTNFKVHTFTGPGTFCVSAAGSGCGNLIDYMVVAGGGGGPASQGGGGGAGGFRESQNAPFAPVYTASPLKSTVSLPVSVQGYPITVGAGGATPGCAKASDGSVSTALTITSAGGGAGGTRFGSPPNYPGNDGGSGGGGGGCASTGGCGNTPPTNPEQGKDGADNSGPDGAASGGGGATVAGTVGGPGRGSPGGAGGAGATTSITGSPVAYAGGGGGGEGGPPGPRGKGAGGTGGGGCGAFSPPGSSPGSGTPGTAGTTNRGGGGGGGGNNSAGNGREGGAGGSGIVVIRYKFQ